MRNLSNATIIYLMSYEITIMNLIGISIAIIGYIISILEYTKEPILSKRLIAILFLSTLALGITMGFTCTGKRKTDIFE